MQRSTLVDNINVQKKTDFKWAVDPHFETNCCVENNLNLQS